MESSQKSMAHPTPPLANFKKQASEEGRHDRSFKKRDEGPEGFALRSEVSDALKGTENKLSIKKTQLDCDDVRSTM